MADPAQKTADELKPGDKILPDMAVVDVVSTIRLDDKHDTDTGKRRIYLVGKDPMLVEKDQTFMVQEAS